MASLTVHTQAFQSDTFSHPSVVFWHGEGSTVQTAGNTLDNDGCTPLMYAVIGKHESQGREMLSRADRLLYQAKADGRDRIVSDQAQSS